MKLRGISFKGPGDGSAPATIKIFKNVRLPRLLPAPASLRPGSSDSQALGSAADSTETPRVLRSSITHEARAAWAGVQVPGGALDFDDATDMDPAQLIELKPGDVRHSTRAHSTVAAMRISASALGASGLACKRYIMATRGTG